MKTVKRIILPAVAAAVYWMAVPGSAQLITTQKNSADFTYQYNGGTIPTTSGGLGNTGYGTGTIAGDIVNLTLSTDGNILETTPTSSSTCVAATPCTKFSFASSFIGGGDTFIASGDTWDTLIDNSTGSTWEIRMRQKTTAELPPSTQPGTLSQLNRFIMRTGDGTDGLQIQVDANAKAYPEAGGIVLDIANNDGELHTYRMAQGGDSNRTDFWFDDTYIGNYSATPNFRNHQWGHPFGWTTGWEIDYIRWEVGGFAPGPVTTGVTGDYNENDVVDAADYVVWRKNEGTTNVLPNDDIGGTIGPDQYTQWKSAFGNTAGTASFTSTVVPEPASSLLVLISASLVWWKARRRAAQD